MLTMKISHHSLRRSTTMYLPLSLSLAVFAGAGALERAFAADPETKKEKPATETAGLVPLNLKLPAPAFKGTPKDIQLSSYVEPLSDKPRAAMMVPSGLKNLAPESKLSSSDKNASQESLAKIVDGDKEASDQSIIFLRKGTQYIQMDLGSPSELFAIVIWHAHNSAKVYHDVIVRVADDAEFTKNARTIFNNDQDDSSK